MATFHAETELPVSAAQALAWHRRTGSFERLVPPWIQVLVLEQTSEGLAGTLHLSVRWRGVHSSWKLEHVPPENAAGFADVLLEGPLPEWRHDHLFHERGRNSCVLEDRLRYALPGGVFGRTLEAPMRRELKRLFRFRHLRAAGDLAAHAKYSRGNPLRILVTGASGLLGRALVPFLAAGGHEVVRLVRRAQPSVPGAFPDPERLEGFDAVIHLAGENIAQGIWTRARKERIWRSRVDGTRNLAEAFDKLERPPGVFVAASAVGVYGDRAGEILDETSATGEGFLAELCQAWEEAAARARKAASRVVSLRFGVVLCAEGGALAKMLPAFRLGLAGPLGNGRQYLSWISRDDAITACLHAVTTSSLEGPVNAVAGAVTNEEFTSTLARVLKRPAFLRVPASILRAALGEMAKETLLASQRVRPHRLVESGFSFRFATLEELLRHELGRAL